MSSEGSFLSRDFFFCDIIIVVKYMQEINNFEDDLKYKLYSNLNKIMHPSISKKNISSYKIILRDDLSLVRVFYPLKVSNLNKVIIYIHGISSVSGCGNHYSDICMNIALKTSQLVIAIDYDEHKKYLECLKDIKKCVQFISEELNNLGIDNDSITLMGDSIGATMAFSVSKILGIIKRNILISPILSGNYFEDVNIIKNDKVNTGLINSLRDYYNDSLRFKKNYKDELVFPLLGKEKTTNNILIITASNDYLKDEAYQFSEIHACDVLEITVGGHGFLKNMSLDIENIFYTRVVDFLEK